MSEGVVARAKFYCSHCGAVHELDKDDIYFECIGGSDRGMGDETQYESNILESCSECGCQYHIKLEVYEYPTGIINYTSESADGVDDLNVSYDYFHERPEPDDSDSSRVMGAAAGGAIFGASIGGPFGALIGGIIGGIIGDSVAKGDKNG